jgi:tripartite-type tricarboxylate transporter receptor subunit TctC
VAPSSALAWPEGPITFVVPFAAGGPTDTVTRLVAEPMSSTLGQQIIVQNVAGAGGTLAAGQVATAAPDGYTVLMHHIGMSTAPSLYPDLPYDPLVDFKTIGLVTEVPMTIIGRRTRADDAPGARRLREGEQGHRDVCQRGNGPPHTCAGCCS